MASCIRIVRTGQDKSPGWRGESDGTESSGRKSGGVLTIDLAGIKKDYVATRDAAGTIVAVKAK